MIKGKKLTLMAYTVMFSIYIPWLYGMFASWHKPVIFDGDYSILGAISVTAWAVCTFCGGLMYRPGGIPHFKAEYLRHKRLGQTKKFLFKFTFSFIACGALFYFTSKAITYPSIDSRTDNTKTYVTFLITDVSSVRRSFSLHRINGFSYLHNKEIRFPWNKKHIDRSWIGSCVILKTDGNKWGKMIRDIEKVSRYRCPEINNE